MIYQLFNEFNHLFVFDPNKKGRKLLTLWKISTHSPKVLICTKKRHWTFRLTLTTLVSWHTPAPKSRDCVRSLAATWRHPERIEFPARVGSCQSSRAELTMLWGFESWLKCLQPRLSPGLAAQWRVPPSSQKCKCSLSNMDFSLEDLKFYAALGSKQRDWFSIASWLVGDSLQFRKNREEEQEVCGKWNMFWQLWPDRLTGEEGLGTTGREGWIKTGMDWTDETTWMCVCYCLPPCFWIVFPVCAPYSPLTESFLRLCSPVSLQHRSLLAKMETEMHLDRGQLTWPQRSSSCSATDYNKNKSSHFIKSTFGYKSHVQSAVDMMTLTGDIETLPGVHTSSGYWHRIDNMTYNVTSHHQTHRIRVACQTSLSNYPLPFPQHQLPVIISCIIDSIDQWSLNTGDRIPHRKSTHLYCLCQQTCIVASSSTMDAE